MKVFVIHYKKMLARKANILRQFERFGITDYEFIDIDRSEIHKYDTRKIDCLIPPAWVAVALSHIYAYNQIAEKYDEALILEDDAIMSDDFMERYALYKAELSNEKYFDMLFLGDGCGLHIPKDNLVPNKHIYYKCVEPTRWGGDGVTRCVDSYIVSKSCARKLCDYIEKIDNNLINKEVDWWLNKVARELNLVVYWAEPTIVTQSSANILLDKRCY